MFEKHYTVLVDTKGKFNMDDFEVICNQHEIKVHNARQEGTLIIADIEVKRVMDLYILTGNIERMYPSCKVYKAIKIEGWQ